MLHEKTEGAVARRSASIYVTLASGTALAFLLAATLVGNYPLMARIGGTVWVGVLSLIVSMPLVTSRVKKRLRRLPGGEPGEAGR